MSHSESQMDKATTVFDAMIKCRAPKKLAARIRRIAERRSQPESIVARDAVVIYADAEEKKLKLPPITPSEVERLLKKAV